MLVPEHMPDTVHAIVWVCTRRLIYFLVFLKHQTVRLLHIQIVNKVSITVHSALRCGSIDFWVLYDSESSFKYELESLIITLLWQFKGVKNVIQSFKKWTSTGKSKNYRN